MTLCRFCRAEAQDGDFLIALMDLHKYPRDNTPMAPGDECEECTYQRPPKIPTPDEFKNSTRRADDPVDPYERIETRLNERGVFEVLQARYSPDGFTRVVELITTLVWYGVVIWSVGSLLGVF